MTPNMINHVNPQPPSIIHHHYHHPSSPTTVFHGTCCMLCAHLTPRMYMSSTARGSGVRLELLAPKGQTVRRRRQKWRRDLRTTPEHRPAPAPSAASALSPLPACLKAPSLQCNLPFPSPSLTLTRLFSSIRISHRHLSRPVRSS